MRENSRVIIEDSVLLGWLKSHGYQADQYYMFYPLNSGERGRRVVVRIQEDNQVEVVFDGEWVSLLDSMNLSTPQDSPEIRARAANKDPWSD